MSPPAAIALPPQLAERLGQDEALVRSGRLQPECRSRLWHGREPEAGSPAATGVVLLLHGFTAGPWQFSELGPLLAKAGFVAYAARLPGHGATAKGPDGQEAGDASGLPRSRQEAMFGATARTAWAEALALAQQLQVPLYLVGHSAGGAMALDLLRHADANICRAALVAPLLRPKRRASYALVQLFGKIPLAGVITDRVRLSWPKAAPRPDGWLRPGHRQFSLGNVVSLFRYATRVRRTLLAGIKRGETLPPIQFVCTENDDKVDLAACRTLAQTPPKRHFLYCFTAAQKVPHAMLTRWENQNEVHRHKALQVVCDFLLHGTGSDTAKPA